MAYDNTIYGTAAGFSDGIPGHGAGMGFDGEGKSAKRLSPMYTEDIQDLSKAVYIYWHVKEMVKGQKEGVNIDEANEKAEQMWMEESEEVKEQFRRAAVVQDIMLGGAMGKRRRQTKGEFAQNRAEYNPFLLYCRDHRENVREKGSRGKGMSTLSAMWKELPDSEKEKYQEQAKANKAKDTQRLETQTTPGPTERNDEDPQKIPQKDGEKPKE